MERVVAIAAMACLTALEITALVMGIDGALFTLVVAAVSGLGGYELRMRRERGV